MIRFTKFLSIFLFVLFFSNSNVYSYGDPDQILCGQWLWKNVLNKAGPCVNAPFCKVGAKKMLRVIRIIRSSRTMYLIVLAKKVYVEIIFQMVYNGRCFTGILMIL